MVLISCYDLEPALAGRLFEFFYADYPMYPVYE